MTHLLIDGGRKLSGEINIHGAKNSVLPILAACYLNSAKTVLHNCPKLSDVSTAIEILKTLGCRVEQIGNDIMVDSSSANNYCIPYKLMEKMRSSIIFMGAILAKCNKAKLCMPGGCELGPRPIDLHLISLKKLGVDITDLSGIIEAKTNGICGSVINLPFPSVGATENIILASVLAKGETVIHNAAREPEIVDLACFLNSCGAQIAGMGSSSIKICGVKKLNGCEHSIIPDRIEAGTYMAAAAITGSTLTLNNICVEHIRPVLYAFNEAGCDFEFSNNSLKIISPKRLNRVKSVRTLVYPGFPTDMLSVFMAAMSVADGTSMFVETIFQNRYKQVSDLVKMGASIKVEERVAVVEGVNRLNCAIVSATDLRGGAALIVAALNANGVTKIYDVKHIDRGYEDIEYTLNSLGARVVRV